MNLPLSTPSGPRKKGEWGFLTNHAHVLLCVAHDPGIRLRDIAAAVGLTERGTHQILSQLVEQHPEAAVVGVRDQLVEVVVAAVLGGDRGVIADVVAEVGQR